MIKEFFRRLLGSQPPEEVVKKDRKNIHIHRANPGHDGLTNHAKYYARIAAQFGYSVEQEQPKNKLLILTKNHAVLGPVQVNVYYSTRTIGTSFKHPSKGKTQLFRKNVNEKEFKAILQNPRAHIGRGYR